MLEPLNQKERKRAFVKFLGFFFIALIPCALAIWAFTSVDKSENKFLKEKYSELKVETVKSKEIRSKLDAIMDQLKTIDEYATTNDISEISSSHYGSVETFVKNLTVAIDEYKERIPNRIEKEESYPNDIHDLLVYNKQLLSVVNAAYKSSWKKMKDQELEIKDLEKKIDKLERLN